VVKGSSPLSFSSFIAHDRVWYVPYMKFFDTTKFVNIFYCLTSEQLVSAQLHYRIFSLSLLLAPQGNVIDLPKCCSFERPWWVSFALATLNLSTMCLSLPTTVLYVVVVSVPPTTNLAGMVAVTLTVDLFVWIDCPYGPKDNDHSHHDYLLE
jgi:hypothetical protein